MEGGETPSDTGIGHPDHPPGVLAEGQKLHQNPTLLTCEASPQPRGSRPMPSSLRNHLIALSLAKAAHDAHAARFPLTIPDRSDRARSPCYPPRMPSPDTIEPRRRVQTDTLRAYTASRIRGYRDGRAEAEPRESGRPYGLGYRAGTRRNERDRKESSGAQDEPTDHAE